MLGHLPHLGKNPKATSEGTINLTDWQTLWNTFFHEPNGKYVVAEIGTHILPFFREVQLALASLSCLHGQITAF